MSSGFVLFLFHDKRHLGEMGAAEVEAFLTHLADEEWVAAATLIQALSALLFLSRKKGGQAQIFISNCFASPEATVSGFLGRPRGRISWRCLVAFAMRSIKRESTGV